MITFDSAKFIAGHEVSGKCFIENQNANSIKLHFYGLVTTSWESKIYEQKHHCSRHNTKSYFTRKTIVEGWCQPVFTGSCFQFLFQLNSFCSPSFNGDYGNIQYYVEVQLGITVIARKEFTVLSKSTKCPESSYPYTSSICKHQSILKSIRLKKETEVSITLPKTNYSPKTIIPITISIRNYTNIHLFAVKCQLIQNVHYTAQRLDSKNECNHRFEEKTSEVVISKERNTVTCSNQDTMFFLSLPHLLIPSFCAETIKLDYCIRIEIGKDKTLSREIPIVIDFFSLFQGHLRRTILQE